MKTLFIIFLFTITLSSYSQERYIQMTKTENGNIKIFDEFKRVKIKTLDDKKIIGKFVIIDAETIAIKGQEIKLSQIKKLKSRSVIGGIFGTILIGYGGLFIAATPTIYSIHGPNPGDAAAFFVTGTVITLSGVFLNEFVNTHHTEKWDYSIVINE